MTESRIEQTGGRAVLQCRRVTMRAFQVTHRYQRFVVLRCSETIARGTPRRYRFQPNRGRYSGSDGAKECSTARICRV